MFYKGLYIQRIYNVYTCYINLKFHVIYILIKGNKIIKKKLIKTQGKSLVFINMKLTNNNIRPIYKPYI